MVVVKVSRDEGELKFQQQVKISISEKRRVNEPIGNVRAAPALSLHLFILILLNSVHLNLFDLVTKILLLEMNHWSKVTFMFM